MSRQVEEQLAKSLTAESTDLLPFLPQLLQDFWELGASSEEIAGLFEQYVPYSSTTRVLDLGCGKGAVSIKLAKRLGVAVKGIDLLAPFIDDAQNKAAQLGVSGSCTFTVGDITKAVETERGWDCVIYGAVGGVLGNQEAVLIYLRDVLAEEGHILLDDAYLRAGKSNGDLKFAHSYPTFAQWNQLFEDTGLELVAFLDNAEADEDGSEELSLIEARAAELSARHPDKKHLFAGYVQSQKNEYFDLVHNVVGVLWLLKKRAQKQQ